MSNQEIDRIVLQVGVPTDRLGYLRHECPACMLEFKIVGEESRFNDVLAAWVSRAVSEATEAADESAENNPASLLHCPYCAKATRAQDFLHEEWRAMMARIAKREILEPMVSKLFNDFASSISRHKSNFLAVRVEHDGGVRSPRPIVGPEPDDMVRVRCLSCDERFKVAEGWRDEIRCPSCASELRLQ